MTKINQETEVKDKIWLKDSITKEMQDLFSVSNPNYFDFEETNKKIRGLVDQLDELEVLSREWISENEEQEEMYGSYGVPVHKLQNLLVPKQEKVKIPQFVADWLDDNIERYETVYSFIISLVEVFGDTVPEKMWTYASENPDTMARAYLDGYEVAEEPKYRLKLNGDYLSRAQIDYEADKGNPMEVTIRADVKGFPYHFSEDEKSYVEKYLNVEVEELEE